MFTPPFRMRQINWSRVRRLPTVVRSGPRAPPLPEIAWQAWQPFCCTIGRRGTMAGSVVPTTWGDSGCAVKLGDQAEILPGHGQRGDHQDDQQRNADRPRAALGVALAAIGQRQQEQHQAQYQRPADDNPVFHDSGGSSASAAKYHRRYQSGRGYGIQQRRVGRIIDRGRANDDRQQHNDNDERARRRWHRARRHPARRGCLRAAAGRDTTCDRFWDPPGARPAAALRCRHAAPCRDGSRSGRK